MLFRSVKAKYLINKTVATVKPRFNDSPCWKSIMKVKGIYLAGRGIKLHNGSLIQFWKDPWLENVPLTESYPLLFDICQSPDISFKQCVEKNFEIPFRRRLHEGLTT